MKTAFVFLADGFEDIEAITPIDLLRRAGAEVTVVAAKGERAVSARGLPVLCDATIEAALALPRPDLVVLPGGGAGSKNLAANAGVEGLTRAAFADNRLVGAICAAPAVALGHWGLVDGRRYTGYPGTGMDLPTKPTGMRVEVEGNLITAQGAGVAEEFSLALIRALVGPEMAAKVAADIVARE